MISNQDFLEFLDEMLAMERQMEAIYRRLGQAVLTPEYKVFFERLAAEESSHENVVRKMMDLFDPGSERSG